MESNNENNNINKLIILALTIQSENNNLSLICDENKDYIEKISNKESFFDSSPENETPEEDKGSHNYDVFKDLINYYDIKITNDVDGEKSDGGGESGGGEKSDGGGLYPGLKLAEIKFKKLRDLGLDNIKDIYWIYKPSPEPSPEPSTESGNNTLNNFSIFQTDKTSFTIKSNATNTSNNDNKSDNGPINLTYMPSDNEKSEKKSGKKSGNQFIVDNPLLDVSINTVGDDSERFFNSITNTNTNGNIKIKSYSEYIKTGSEKVGGGDGGVLAQDNQRVGDETYKICYGSKLNFTNNQSYKNMDNIDRFNLAMINKQYVSIHERLYYNLLYDYDLRHPNVKKYFITNKNNRPKYINLVSKNKFKNFKNSSSECSDYNQLKNMLKHPEPGTVPKPNNNNNQSQKYVIFIDDKKSATLILSALSLDDEITTLLDNKQIDIYYLYETEQKKSNDLLKTFITKHYKMNGGIVPIDYDNIFSDPPDPATATPPESFYDITETIFTVTNP